MADMGEGTGSELCVGHANTTNTEHTKEKGRLQRSVTLSNIDEEVEHLQDQFRIRWDVPGKATVFRTVSDCATSSYQIVVLREDALEAADIRVAPDWRLQRQDRSKFGEQ